MHFHPTLAAVAGATLFSVASAGRVCRIKSNPGPNNGGWQPAVVPQDSQPVPNNGGWQNQPYTNLDGNTIIIRTTTLAHTYCNPPPTGVPQWNQWASGNPVPTSTAVVGPNPTQGWASWNSIPGGTITTSGGVIVNPTGLPTDSTTTTTTTIASSLTNDPSPILTSSTFTTITTTTTTAPAATTTGACPNAPAGIFYLQATNTGNTALEGRFAGLANNGFGNLVAFSETDITNAVQVTFDADCSLISAVGPLVILDNGTPQSGYYQYMNEEGTQDPAATRFIDTCSADANNVLTCNVNTLNTFQTQTDILTIADGLVYDAATIVLVPA